jgi:ribosome-associated protein
LEHAGREDALDNKGRVIEMGGEVDGAAALVPVRANTKRQREVPGAVTLERDIGSLGGPSLDPRCHAELAPAGGGELGQVEEPAEMVGALVGWEWCWGHGGSYQRGAMGRRIQEARATILSGMDPTPPTSGIELAPHVRVPESALEFSFVSSSGPGGQNVNKKATKAVLRLRLHAIPIHPDAMDRLRALGSFYVTDAGELVIACDEYRSQERNKDGCLERLRALIIQSQKRPKVRRATKPSRGSKERRLTEKRVRSDRKKGRRGEE